MATLREVAARAGVDASTASKVLAGGRIRVAEATRERILAAARELDYTPDPYAQGLRTRRRGAIAMAVRETTNFVFPEIVIGAEEEAEARGLSLFLVKQAARDPAARLLSIMRQGRMDGWILADEPPCESFVSDARALGIPLVTLNRLEPGPGPWVCLDDEAGFRVQAERLVASRHLHVAFIEGRPASFVSRLCAKSFVDRMNELGGSVRVLGGRFDGDDSEIVADALLALVPRPTAVACGSSQAAARLIESLSAKGLRIPSEMGVIGYHDVPPALTVRPRLTTVRMPSREQGRRGVVRLLEVLDGVEFDGEIVEDAPTVSERESL